MERIVDSAVELAFLGAATLWPLSVSLPTAHNPRSTTTTLRLSTVHSPFIGRKTYSDELSYHCELEGVMIDQ